MTQPTKKREPVDSTIVDIHRTRERISDAFGGDISAITADAKRRQEASKRRTISFAEAASGTVQPLVPGVSTSEGG